MGNDLKKWTAEADGLVKIITGNFATPDVHAIELLAEALKTAYSRGAAAACGQVMRLMRDDALSTDELLKGMGL